MHPAIALQGEIYTALVNSTDLISNLGGAFIYDDVPDGQKPPYVLFGPAIYSNWTTSTEGGTEHAISLDIWSSENGRKQVLEIATHIEAALNALPQSISGHHLINFDHQNLEVRRDGASRYFHGILNCRAVTEPE
ncbi:MAG: DUF3168 domain-containing protein [Rhizobiaceae bacterium]|nr:DUF3168 domain-containing protein [Rhizobiaceae bacterium]